MSVPNYCEHGYLIADGRHECGQCDLSRRSRVLAGAQAIRDRATITEWPLRAPTIRSVVLSNCDEGLYVALYDDFSTGHHFRGAPELALHEAAKHCRSNP